MERNNRDYPVAYAPIPKGIIKVELVEEPNFEEIQEECGEYGSEPLMAYLPLPHGVIKEEMQLEDDDMKFSFGVQEIYICLQFYINHDVVSQLRNAVHIISFLFSFLKTSIIII